MPYFTIAASNTHTIISMTETLCFRLAGLCANTRKKYICTPSFPPSSPLNNLHLWLLMLFAFFKLGVFRQNFQLFLSCRVLSSACTFRLLSHSCTRSLGLIYHSAGQADKEAFCYNSSSFVCVLSEYDLNYCMERRCVISGSRLMLVAEWHLLLSLLKEEN